MPIVLRCNKCEVEEISGSCRGNEWLTKPLVGRMLVLCKKCRVSEDIEDELEARRQFEIDVRVKSYRARLEKEISIEDIRTMKFK